MPTFTVLDGLQSAFSRDNNILQTIFFVAVSFFLRCFILIRFSLCLLFAHLLSGMSGVTGAALRETSHINKR